MSVLLSADSSFERYTFNCYYAFIIKMTRAQRELLEQRICNFYCDAAKKSVKTTGNYFKKQNTVYYILIKYLRYGTTKDLSRSGRPVKLSTKDFNRLVISVNNRCARSQRKLG